MVHLQVALVSGSLESPIEVIPGRFTVAIWSHDSYYEVSLFLTVLH